MNTIYGACSAGNNEDFYWSSIDENAAPSLRMAAKEFEGRITKRTGKCKKKFAQFYKHVQEK